MNLNEYKEKVFAERPEAKEEYEKLVDHDFLKELGERVAAGIEDYVKLQEAVKEIGMERLLELVEADGEGRCAIFPCKDWLGKVFGNQEVFFAVDECRVKKITVQNESRFHYWSNNWETVTLDGNDEFGEIFEFYPEDIGETVFYTHEEAEQALKKMKEGQGNETN